MEQTDLGQTMRVSESQSKECNYDVTLLGTLAEHTGMEALRVDWRSVGAAVAVVGLRLV